MERLAILERTSFRGEPEFDLDAIRAASRRRVFRTCFGLGLAGSGIAGGVALLILLFVHPEPANLQRTFSLPEALASITPAWTSAVSFRPDTLAPAAPSSAPVLDIVLHRSHGAVVPLPLQVSGVRDPDAATVWLRDMPEPVWLSQGERRDEHTWSLRLAELKDLYVTLADGVPDDFRIRIEVSTREGARAAQAIARVRVHGAPVAPPSMRSGAAEPRIPEAPASPRSAGPTVRAVADMLVPAASAPIAPAAVATASVAPSPVAAPHARLRTQRPEGMSTLGALPREPADSRQVWWKMPLPDWAPFAEAVGR